MARNVDQLPATTTLTEAARVHVRNGNGTDYKMTLPNLRKAISGVAGTWDMTPSTSQAEFEAGVSQNAAAAKVTNDSFTMTPTLNVSAVNLIASQALSLEAASGAAKIIGPTTPGSLVRYGFLFTNDSATAADVSSAIEAGFSAVGTVTELMALDVAIGGDISLIWDTDDRPQTVSVVGTESAIGAGGELSMIVNLSTGDVTLGYNAGANTYGLGVDYLPSIAGDGRLWLFTVFPTVAATFPDTTLEFDFGDSTNSRTPFVAFTDPALPSGAADARKYLVSVGGRYGGRRTEAGDIVEFHSSTALVQVYPGTPMTADLVNYLISRGVANAASGFKGNWLLSATTVTSVFQADGATTEATGADVDAANSTMTVTGGSSNLKSVSSLATMATAGAGSRSARLRVPNFSGSNGAISLLSVTNPEATHADILATLFANTPTGTCTHLAALMVDHVGLAGPGAMKVLCVLVGSTGNSSATMYSAGGVAATDELYFTINWATGAVSTVKNSDAPVVNPNVIDPADLALLTSVKLTASVYLTAATPSSVPVINFDFSDNTGGRTGYLGSTINPPEGAQDDYSYLVLGDGAYNGAPIYTGDVVTFRNDLADLTIVRIGPTVAEVQALIDATPLPLVTAARVRGVVLDCANDVQMWSDPVPARGDVCIVGSSPTGDFSTFTALTPVIYDGVDWQQSSWADLVGMQFLVHQGVNPGSSRGVIVDPVAVANLHEYNGYFHPTSTFGSASVDYNTLVTAGLVIFPKNNGGLSYTETLTVSTNLSVPVGLHQFHYAQVTSGATLLINPTAYGTAQARHLFLVVENTTGGNLAVTFEYGLGDFTIAQGVKALFQIVDSGSTGMKVYLLGDSGIPGGITYFGSAAELPDPVTGSITLSGGVWVATALVALGGTNLYLTNGAVLTATEKKYGVTTTNNPVMIGEDEDGYIRGCTVKIMNTGSTVVQALGILGEAVVEDCILIGEYGVAFGLRSGYVSAQRNTLLEDHLGGTPTAFGAVDGGVSLALFKDNVFRTGSGLSDRFMTISTNLTSARGIFVEGNKVRGDGSTLNIFSLTGATPTLNSLVVRDNHFSGFSTESNQGDLGSIKGIFASGNFGVKNSQPHAVVYMDDNATATVVTTMGEEVGMAGLLGFGPTTMGFTLEAAPLYLQYQGLHKQRVHVRADYYLTSENNGDVIRAGVGHNGLGMVAGASTKRTVVTAGDYVHLYAEGIYDIENLQTLRPSLINTTSTGDITVKEFRMVVTPVG